MSAAVQYLIYLARENRHLTRESRYCAKYKQSPISVSLPNKSDIEQAVDQTTVLIFSPRILVYISLTIMITNYIKNYKLVLCAQLRKSSFKNYI